VGECFFWYRPTRVVPDKGPLNGCVCVCDYYFFYHRVHLCFSYIGEFDLLMIAADFPSIAFCIRIVAVVFRRVRFVVFRIMSMMPMVYMIV